MESEDAEIQGNMDNQAEGREASGGTDAAKEIAQDEEGIEDFLTAAIGPVCTDVLKDLGDTQTFDELLEEAFSLVPDGEVQDEVKEENSQSPSKSVVRRMSFSPRRKSTTAESGSTASNNIQKEGSKEKSEEHTVPRPTKSKGLEIEQGDSNKISSKLLRRERNKNLKRHKNCAAQNKQICQDSRVVPCCVIVYDVLKTKQFSNYVTPLTVPKLSDSGVTLCMITKFQIHLFHEFEKRKRMFYVTTFGGVKSVPCTTSSLRPIQNVSGSAETTSTSQQCDKSVPDRINKNSDATESKKKKLDEREDDKGKPAEVPDTQAIETDLKENSDQPKSSNSEDKAIDSDEEAFSNMKKYSRKREKNETKREKDKRFEKLENERNRKLSDKKPTKCDSNLFASMFTPMKPLPTKFRIPKTEDPKKIQNSPQQETKEPSGSPVKQISPEDPKKMQSSPKKETEERSGSPVKQISPGGPKANQNFAQEPTDRISQEDPKTKQDSPQRGSVDGGGGAPVKLSQDYPKKNQDCLQQEIADRSDSPVKHISQSLPSVDATASDTNLGNRDLDACNDTKIEEPNADGGSIVVDTTTTAIVKQAGFEDAKAKVEPTGSIKESQPAETTPVPDSINMVLEPPHCKGENNTAEQLSENDECAESDAAGGSLPPISEVQLGEFAMAVTQLMSEKASLPSTFESYSNSCDPITEKCAWWFSKCDKDLLDFASCRFEVLKALPSDNDSNSDSSFTGYVSDPDTSEETQVHEISSSSTNKKTSRDPDRVDEFCGRSLLQAKIRLALGEDFKSLFDIRPGNTYDEKESFQALCNLCDQLIVGKRGLARHVRGKIHRDNLRKIDTKMETTNVTIKEEPRATDNDRKSSSSDKDKNKQSGERSKRKPKIHESLTKDKQIKIEDGVKVEYGTTSTGLQVKIPVESVNEGKEARKRPRSNSVSRDDRRSSPVRIPRSPKAKRSRSRSPDRSTRRPKRSRSRSRSPHHSAKRRSRSRDRGHRSRRRSSEKDRRGKRSRSRSAERQRRTRKSRTRSPVMSLPKKDNKEFHEKLVLTAEGKWNAELEKQWNLMETEEAIFREQFLDRKKAFTTAPEDHPNYGAEWSEFWERRYQEVENEGGDPEKYDYIGEWKGYWQKRMHQLLQDEADQAILNIKKRFNMDFESLSCYRKYGAFNPPPPLQTPVVVAPVPAPVPLPVIPPSAETRVQAQPKLQPSLSIEQFKSNWEAMTRPKGSEMGSSTLNPELQIPSSMLFPASASSRSDITSSSDGSYDFCGFDLVQALRLMCQAEMYLSFLAPKVKDFYKMAEELELKKSKGSYILLHNEELVNLLFQTRDRFMTLIRSNVLQGEPLKTLNLTLYALSTLLDAPQCQQFRPKQPYSFPDLPTPSSDEPSPSTQPQPSSVAKTIPEHDVESVLKTERDTTVVPISEEESQEFSNLTSSLSTTTKELIATEVANYLLLVGGQTMSDSRLKKFLIDLLNPLTKKSKKEEDWENSETTGSKKRSNSQTDDFDINAGKQHETTILGHDYTHSSDMRIAGVSGLKTVGSALPALPFSYRHGHQSQHQAASLQDTRPRQSIFASYGAEESAYNAGFEGPRSSVNGGGRKSPFSQRELASNPLANRDRY